MIVTVVVFSFLSQCVEVIHLLFLMVMFVLLCFFFFKQKTAYEMRISDWSSDVCSSDLCRCPDGDRSDRWHRIRADSQRPVRGECRLSLRSVVARDVGDRKSVV